MKRLFLSVTLIALLTLAAILWAPRIVERVLDAELAPLLTREIGITTSLGPLTADLRTMTARSPRLVMGDPQHPAVLATDVEVRVDWRALLHSELRLLQASASKLVVAPSRWPGNDDPWPSNYDFLEPILPTHMTVSSGLYIGPAGEQVATRHLLWLRADGGASLRWQQDYNDRTLAFSAQLTSLQDLLQLARMQLQLQARTSGDDGEAVRAGIELQPGKTSGYQLLATLDGAGMEASVTAGSKTSWTFPAHSSTRMKRLDIGSLHQLVTAFSRPGTAAAPAADPLAATLPRLQLPKHRGSVAIDTIVWQDEVVTGNSLQFSTGEQGLDIPAFAGAGPGGNLQGSAAVASSADGWQVSLLAEITASGIDQKLVSSYLGNDWIWNSGNARLQGSGDTWEALLNSLRGQVDLAGVHRGSTDTPVTLQAELDNKPDSLAINNLDVRVAGGSLKGQIELSSLQRRKLSGRLNASSLQLGFLADPERQDTLPGLPLPTFINALPGIDLDWDVRIDGLDYENIHLARADARLQRTADRGELSVDIEGKHRGKIALQLSSLAAPGDETDVRLRIDLADVSMGQLIGGQAGALDIRTSGSLVTTARGEDVEGVLSAMRGQADLVAQLGSTGSATATDPAANRFTVQGNARLVLAQHRIVGLDISGLLLEAARQNLGGELSMVSGRNPWLIARLTSDKLDVDHLLELFGERGDSGDHSDGNALQTLRDSADTQIFLQAKSVTIRDLTLPRVVVDLASNGGRLSLRQLDLDTGTGTLKGSGQLGWQGNTATMAVDLALDSVSLDPLLGENRNLAPVPVSGTVKFSSSGGTTGALLANLSGEVHIRDDLPGDGAGADSSRRELQMTARRTDSGMEAVVERLLWQKTDVAGKLVYTDGTPSAVSIELSGGTLSLLPWEAAETTTGGEDQQDSGALAAVTKGARTGIDFVGALILSPLSWMKEQDAAAPGQRLFSSRPLPFDTLADYQATVAGNLNRLETREATLQDLDLSVSLNQGRLAGTLQVGQYNQGNAQIELDLNAAVAPAAVTLKGTFANVRSQQRPKSFSRSGHFNLSTQGNSQAELAANLDGFIYLELGAGELDYRDVKLLTADVATEAFRALIPGLESKQPRLECGATLGLFNAGQGITPYGYAARTREANLVGRAKVDLARETMEMEFSSSNRKGIGISVSSVFSNTVEIQGPLSDPKVVPNTAGLLWRGWAAMMTGGLSVIGESMFKRVLASDNPCESVIDHIHKDFCPKNPAAAASPMVCPAS
ncbi:MAG: AsmA family protein [Pseudomonadales bacterium]|nr:AsmA family protein [Pseudomonadales bacterium]